MLRCHVHILSYMRDTTHAPSLQANAPRERRPRIRQASERGAGGMALNGSQLGQRGAPSMSSLCAVVLRVSGFAQYSPILTTCIIDGRFPPHTVRRTRFCERCGWSGRLSSRRISGMIGDARTVRIAAGSR